MISKLFVMSVVNTVVSTLRPTRRTDIQETTRVIVHQPQSQIPDPQCQKDVGGDIAEILFLALVFLSMILGVLLCSFGLFKSDKNDNLEEELGEYKTDEMDVHFERYI